jgi:hypothetical protein
MTPPFDSISNFLFTSSHFYTIVVGMDSHYSYVCPNYNLAFNFDNDTLQGKHFSVTLHPDDVEVCAAAGYKCLVEPGKLVPVTLRKHNGKGGYVITQWEMQTMLDKQLQPTGIFCIGYNITDYIEAKAKLNNAETQLEEINFIQSHHVRKPLANILGLITLLEKEPGADSFALMSGMLRQSATELDAVIRNISQRAGNAE